MLSPGAPGLDTICAFAEDASLYLLLLLALFLFPVAVYCSILGMINRRMQPLMVSGAWDFVGLLLATSGFLLFVGPALLSGNFRQSLRDLPFSARDGGSIGSAFSEIWGTWWVAWLLYYLLVVGGAGVMVWLRRSTTVIYNIDPRAFDTVLMRVAQRLGLQVNRLGNRLFLGVSGQPIQLSDAGEDSTEVMGGPPVPVAAPRVIAEQVIVDVDEFTALRNVALHWKTASPEARADLQRELGKSLAEVVTLDNPVGGWLLGIAAFLFLAIMMLTAVFVLVTLTATRR
jgi:hypothetical protein